MMHLRPLTIIFCAVVFASGAASGEDVVKTVGDKVSFRPVEPLSSPFTSIIWKHQTSDGTVVKAIEWEYEETELNGETTILNPRFKGVTSVDVKTGEITITNLKHEHSGVYFMEINSKEQEQRFTLTVKDPVPKPEIKIELTGDPNRVYLNCEYSERIIWKNSAGERLTGSSIGKTKGESILVVKADEINRENFYTCTLDNGPSKKTSDPVYVRDLFKDGSKGSIWGFVIPLGIFAAAIIIFIVFIVLYIRNEDFRKRVDDCCPWIGVFVAFCCSCIVKGKEKNPEETPAAGGKEKNSEESPYENETETDPESVPLKNK